MPTVYKSSAAGDVLQNAPIYPGSQSFFVQQRGVFCNSGCGCDCNEESVRYLAELDFTGGDDNVRHYPTQIVITLDGVSTTIAFPKLIDVTIPANQAEFEAMLLDILKAYLAGGGELDVDLSITGGLATAMDISFSAGTCFVPVSISFLNDLNVTQTVNFVID